ncbi:MAG: DUF432 domain-containing protein [Candidatus Kapaibacteriota bacterium]|jgi:hypothetical protein
MQKLFLSKYGIYPFLDSYESDKFSFSFLKENNSLCYTRKVVGGESKTFWIPFDEYKNVIIQPSEPLVSDLPKTRLYLELDEPLSMFPDSFLAGFITVPLTVAIFLENSKKQQLVDLLHISPIKFALYGNPHNGDICRYWKTKFSLVPIETTIFETALMELEIENVSSSAILVSKLIFDFAYIKIFYNENIAKIKGRAKIQSETYCETEFLEPSELNGFNQSIDLIPTKLLSSSKYLMTNGL